MKYLLSKIIPLFFSFLIFFQLCNGQVQDSTPKNISQEMPKLEIPEITIIGKKAITLPFARKGETYDVNIYKAPEFNQSLIGDRITFVLPKGKFARYEERRQPLRLALDGTFGSLPIAKFNTYLDHNTLDWGLTGRAGYGTTSGHVKNADANSFNAEANAYSLINTDNDLLKTLRLAFGLGLSADKYKLFGRQDTVPDRSRNNTAINIQLGSMRQQSVIVDVGLNANITTLTDEFKGQRFKVNTFSPNLNSLFGFDIGGSRLTSEFNYKSSALDFEDLQTPSLVSLVFRSQWNYSESMQFTIGGTYAVGSGSDGSSKSLIRPNAFVRWQMSEGNEISFWYEPKMEIRNYLENFNIVPYLDRKINLNPEISPLQLGFAYNLTSEKYAIETRASFIKTSNKTIVVADNNRLVLDYVEALQTTLQINGKLELIQNLLLKGSGTLQPTYVVGKSEQLPMIPLFKSKISSEYTFSIPLTISTTFEYWTKQNVTLDPVSPAIGEVFLLGLGATSRIIPRTFITFEISNLLNTKYFWWEGYKAPGIQFLLSAQVNVF